MSIDERNEEILSAFVDGEEVGDDELARALAAPGGREALVDFVRLRERFARDDAAPGETFYARARVRGRHAAARGVHRDGGWRRWAATAAVVTVVGLGAWELSRHASPPAGPPEPDRVIEFELGTEWRYSQ